MSYWKDKVVLITGASSGIGKGLALKTAKRGAKLGLIARRADLLDQLVKEVEAHGGKALALTADVQDYDSITAAVSRLREEFGAIDLLIANAGIGATMDGSELRPAEVANVINVNVLGAVNSVSAVIPGFLENGRGHLVVISSLAAYRGLPKSAAYCASKAGISAFFESLRLDLEPRGIAVTIIHPGFIKTALTAGRQAKMPYLMELDDAIQKIVWAIERRRRSYAFPWQLATIVRAAMVMPNFMYDWISRRNSYRE